eukprot:s586_g3.t1
MCKHFWDNNQVLFKDALSRKLASNIGRWQWSMNVSKAGQSVWKWLQGRSAGIAKLMPASPQIEPQPTSLIKVATPRQATLLLPVPARTGQGGVGHCGWSFHASLDEDATALPPMMLPVVTHLAEAPTSSRKSSRPLPARLQRLDDQTVMPRECEVGFNSFLPGARLQGVLRLRSPFLRDLQRHDVLQSGEVLHLTSAGGLTPGPVKTPFLCAVYACGKGATLRSRLAEECGDGEPW